MEVRGRGPLRFTTKIYPNDVLFGRGSPSYHNEGNIRLRELVKARGSEYAATNKHEEKTKIAAEVVQIVLQRQGRFLRKIETQQELTQFSIPDDAEEAYVIVDDTTIFKKVKQLLREQKLISAKGVHSKVNEGTETAAQVASEANQNLETSKNSSETSNKDEGRKRSRDKVTYSPLRSELSNSTRPTLDNDSERIEKSEVLKASYGKQGKPHTSSIDVRTLCQQNEPLAANNQSHQSNSGNQSDFRSPPRQLFLPESQNHLFSAQAALLQNNPSQQLITQNVNESYNHSFSQPQAIPDAIGQFTILPMNSIPVQIVYLTPSQMQGLTQDNLMQRNQILLSSNQQQERRNTSLHQAFDDFHSTEVQQFLSPSHVQSSETWDADESPSRTAGMGSSSTDNNRNFNQSLGLQQRRQHHAVLPSNSSVRQSSLQPLDATSQTDLHLTSSIKDNQSNDDEDRNSK